jgi:predicted CXXCH cytochrome family protein
MKLWTILTALGAAVAMTTLSLTSQGAVKDTKHNMNLSFGTGTIQDNQVCLPCHAPHNQPDRTQDVLWNHVMPTVTYTLYSTGVDTNGKPVVESASVVGLDETSKKCLSCHDGTVAVDSYGGYQFAAAGSGTGSTFNQTTGSHKLGAGNDAFGNSTAGFVVGTGGDLSHDHPVGVLYPASGYIDPATWTRTGYTNSTGVVNYVKADGTPGGTVAGGGMTLEGGNIKGVGVVGCGSCHTPHSDTYNFLVISNYGSQLCMSCHTR